MVGHSSNLFPNITDILLPDEYTKTARHNNRGPGVTTSVLALISTELKIASDFFQTIADILGPKYEESKKKGAEYVREAEDKAQHYKELGQDKLNDYTKHGQQKVDELNKEGQKKADEAKAKGEDVKEQAKGAKEEAQKKAQK